MGYETGMYLVLESYQSQVKTHFLTPDALAHILVPSVTVNYLLKSEKSWDLVLVGFSSCVWGFLPAVWKHDGVIRRICQSNGMFLFFLIP